MPDQGLADQGLADQDFADRGTADPKVAYVVSHTHWDREWSLPFASFRTRRLEVLGGVLDALEDEASSFEHFCLDGRAIVLEDVLATAPEEDARIRRLAQAGKLSLGPWYVLPDEFLIRREATVRNLQLGPG